MTIGAWYILRRHLWVFRRTWWSNVMFNLIEPFLYLTAMGFGLGAFVHDMEGASYLQFIAPGMVASSAMFAATFECSYGSFVRLHFQKTFQAMLSAPPTVEDVVAGEILFGVCKSVVFGTIILLCITTLGLVQAWTALLIPLFLTLPGAVFSVLALAYTGRIANIDYLNHYITLFVTPMYLFAGVFFPVGSMPDWLQWIIQLNPLFHSVEICRALAAGRMEGLGSHLLLLAGLLAVLIWLPVRIYRKRLIV